MLHGIDGEEREVEGNGSLTPCEGVVECESMDVEDPKIQKGRCDS